MSIVRIIATPLMGALIGYGTNYVAIKMLFRPRTAKYIGKFRIPFTPGIIPSQRGRIASAVGAAVSGSLLSGSDIHSLIMQSPIADILLDGIMDKAEENRDRTVEEIVKSFAEEEKYNDIKSKVHGFVCEKILSGIDRVDLAKLIEEEGVQLIKDKFAGSMIGMFMTDNMIHSVAAPVGDAIKKCVDERGYDIISPIVADEIESLEKMPLHEAMKKLKLNRDSIKKILDGAVKNGGEYVRTVFEKLNIAGTVEQKILEMDIIEIEKLILSVMKRELNAIVNLGALLGFVLGIVMIFIQ
ncbi:MAG: DUF445 family protein [bacterium]|nr:DUF445 family protein [bacterium]